MYPRTRVVTHFKHQMHEQTFVKMWWQVMVPINVPRFGTHFRTPPASKRKAAGTTRGECFWSHASVPRWHVALWYTYCYIQFLLLKNQPCKLHNMVLLYKEQNRRSPAEKTAVLNKADTCLLLPTCTKKGLAPTSQIKLHLATTTSYGYYIYLLYI